MPAPGSHFALMAKPKIELLCPDSCQTTQLHNCSVNTPFGWALCFLCQACWIKHSFAKAFNIKTNPKTCGLSFGRKFRFVPFSSFVS